jgi:hypothetical protein
MRSIRTVLELDDVEDFYKIKIKIRRIVLTIKSVPSIKCFTKYLALFQNLSILCRCWLCGLGSDKLSISPLLTEHHDSLLQH